MKKVVLITELCSEGNGSQLCYYDKLPLNVKKIVDMSLFKGDEVPCDIYKDGLQYLIEENRFNNLNVFVSKGSDNLDYMGEATIYHMYD